jgi:serine O-acetyltransferase
MFDSFRADCRVNTEYPLSRLVMAIYRYGNWVHRKVRIPVVSHILWAIYWVAYIAICYMICGSAIPAKCTIGRGLSLPHPFGIFLTRQVVIGDNALIMHQVTIGFRGESRDSPILGNDVYVGAGAKILGRLTVGNNSFIGANAVVLDDVPSNATAVGIPARVIATK